MTQESALLLLLDHPLFNKSEAGNYLWPDLQGGRYKNNAGAKFSNKQKGYQGRAFNEEELTKLREYLQSELIPKLEANARQTQAYITQIREAFPREPEKVSERKLSDIFKPKHLK